MIATAPQADDEDDEWANEDDAVIDQLWLYEHEPFSMISIKDSHIYLLG
jgi:hypothetical protein